MNEKKNIDKLFKEQFKNFDVAPKEHVWENIEERLHEDKRKKRRVIPIWWRVAGIAAGLVLLFTVANQFFKASDKDEFSKEVIVEQPNLNNNSNSEDENNTLNQKDSDASKEILGNDIPENIVTTNSKTSVEEERSSLNKNKSNTRPSDQSYGATIASDDSNKTNRKEENEFSNSKTSNNYNKDLLKDNKTPVKNPVTKDAVALSTKANSETNQDEQNTIKNKSEIDKLLKSKDSDSNTTIADVNTNKKDGASEKESSETEFNTTNDIEKQIDKEETNAIENAIADAENTEEKEEEEEKLNRWSVSPIVAPVYFSSLGEGSSLDNQFVKNTKESEINMSYGINGSYAINKKFKIRAGINKVQLGYQTNDVIIFENTDEFSARNSSQMDNLDMTVVAGRYSVYSANSFKFENAPATLFTQEQGSIDQQLGFIEVPVEIEYNLIERKVGLNLIGGFSALFLNENDVFAVLNTGERARLGEASNVKDLSYSANFGIGLDYNFSEQFQLNLEPTFKYQINTFNNTSGDFNPFFIGIYTGLSFKF